MVTGGEGSRTPGNTTEILSLETLQWTTGPELPVATGKGRLLGASVYQLENSFYILGGNDGYREVDTIYEFDLQTFSWRLKTDTVGQPKKYHSVVPIPKDYLDLN